MRVPSFDLVAQSAGMDTRVRLEHPGGFTLSMIKGTKQLCLLCTACRIPTGVVSAWIQCRHWDKPLTKLTFCKQEPLSYNVDLQSGLCTLQP